VYLILLNVDILILSHFIFVKVINILNIDFMAKQTGKHDDSSLFETAATRHVIGYNYKLLLPSDSFMEGF
jgi:hypothetical protein